MAGVRVPFFKPFVGPEEEAALLRVLRSGWFTTGTEAKSFEAEFSRFVGAPHCLAVNSATSGLLLSYQALGVGPGTSIITTPYTFVSTATMALHLGAQVVYADIEEGSYNIDPACIEERLKDARTHGHDVAAIVVVHIAGLPADMRSILEIGRRYGVPVIEDAAHAFPAKTSLGYAGTLGDAGVFSFYATKTITTGEGGMVVVRDSVVSEAVSRIRSNGIDRPVWDRYINTKAGWEYDVADLGWKANLPDLLAALGRAQLERAEDLRENRSAVAALYNRAFAGKPYLRVPPDGEGNAWHLYLLRVVPEKLDISRDAFAKLLQEKGIGVSMHFIPHFFFSWFKAHSDVTAADFPYATMKADETISLPLWPGMDALSVNAVIEAVLDIGEAHSEY